MTTRIDDNDNPNFSSQELTADELNQIVGGEYHPQKPDGSL